MNRISISEPGVTTIDGNEAVARIAYALNEVIAVFPITPATPMGEWADQWAAAGAKNLWGTVPSVIELQSEGGAAGALHGALQTGALATTFTASQGLLLMLPNMFKIAGELTPAVFHIASRALAAQALSIFGDHSDVMAARTTGWAMLGAASVQEAQDFALIAQAATLESRIPFLHFFDGFRTSHEIAKIEFLEDSVLRAMIHDEWIAAHRARALSPDHPVLRGTAQNSDVYFQARETVNPFYAACPQIVQGAMDRFAKLTGRQYRIFEYYGAPDAERVIVLMGSGCEAAHETVDFLNFAGAGVGVLKVRLYRPFDTGRFLAVLPRSVKSIAVLDRTKEPGGPGEPLYLDCVNALYASPLRPRVVGGRYGLASKEFTPAMIKAVFDNLAAPEPRNHFTIGIQDDLSGSSLAYDPAFSIERDDVYRAIFYGLGSDGTVGANKEKRPCGGATTVRRGANGCRFPPAFLSTPRRARNSHHRNTPMNLGTTYLGLKLRTPLVISASPLSQSLDNIRRLEDAGASAIVLPSLFEEQLRIELNEMHHSLTQGTESYADAVSYFPEPSQFRLGPERYLEHVALAKEAVRIPIIGSINGTTFGGWTTYARQIEQAGADGVELNIYSVPTDSSQTADDVETGYLSIVAAVKAQVEIPVAVKLSPYFTNLSLFARQLDDSGVDGLVLFNRFYQPDIDLEALELAPSIQLSTPNAMRLPLRWIAILHGHLRASLAATSGIHRGTDAIKMLMAGADVTMLCSALLARGIDYLAVVEREMREWLEQHEYESVAQLKGSMSQKRCADPAAFERGQYMRALSTYPAARV